MGQINSFHSDIKDNWTTQQGLQNRLPLIEICGRKRVLIENHRGILSYGSQEIRIKVCFGCVYVLGKDLQIRKICKEKLVIFGVIDAVEFQRRD